MIDINDKIFQIFIEITSLCNMHCTFCPSDIMVRKKCNAKTDDVKKLLSELYELGYTKSVLFNVLGEPLINNNIFEYLDMCEKYNFCVILITNFTILNSECAEKLLKYNNLVLVLSLQTVNEDSYKMRGYSALDYKKYEEQIFRIIEIKFRLHSQARIEVHVAQNYNILHGDSSIITDSDINIWKNFTDEAHEKLWLENFISSLEEFKNYIKNKYPNAYLTEQEYSLKKYDYGFQNKTIVYRTDELPINWQNMTEDVFWGYMFLPNTFLRFKTFGLWNRSSDFLKNIFKNYYFYVEDKIDKISCSIASCIAMLSNGHITACCLDYEGNINLGNIQNNTLEGILYSNKRKYLVQNVINEPTCRKCKGNLFIFDKKPLLNESIQNVLYGRGYFPYEKEMNGRWSSYMGYTYVYTRINASQLIIHFYSPFDELTEFMLIIYEYNETINEFIEVSAASFKGTTINTNVKEFIYDFTFNINKFYRFAICSPTFNPKERNKTSDDRNLGLAVLSFYLSV